METNCIYHISLVSVVGHIDADRHTVNDSNFIKELEKIDEKSYRNNVKDVISFDLLKGLNTITLNAARCYLWRRIKQHYGKTNIQYSDFSFEFRVSTYDNFIDTHDKPLEDGVFASWHNGQISTQKGVTKIIMNSLDTNDQILINNF